MATHSSILAWRIPLDREAWWVTVQGVVKSQMPLSTCMSVHSHTHAAHTCSRVWNRPLNRYFQELISRVQSLHLLISRKTLNPFMVTSAPCDKQRTFSKISA